MRDVAAHTVYIWDSDLHYNIILPRSVKALLEKIDYRRGERGVCFGLWVWWVNR